MAVPQEPVVFMKATSSTISSNDDVMIPRNSQNTDWEVELGVIIGRTARYVEAADALSYVGGYCVVNDLSERAFRLEGTGRGSRAKAARVSAPWQQDEVGIDDPGEQRQTVVPFRS